VPRLWRGNETRTAAAPPQQLCQLPCLRACGTTVTRTGAAAHEAECPLLAVKCAAADFGCDWSGRRHQQAAHTAACGLRGVLPALRKMAERIDEQSQRIATLEAQLAEHTKPSVWHHLRDAFCVANGVTLRNGWNPAKSDFWFTKDRHGFVHLDGIIRGGNADSDHAVLTLPEGYHPRDSILFNGGQAFGEVLIDPLGDIYVQATGAKDDGISFGGVSFSTR